MAASDTDSDQVIPFYGGQHPELFEIERRCMDRAGHVLDLLDAALPDGLVLDIGAGNGFTAARLASAKRTVVPMEPDPAMVDQTKPLLWTRGVAQDIPFHDATFDAAYATWAFFFRGVPDLDDGLRELVRVVEPEGKLVVVDNAGDDEFCALTDRTISSDPAWWTERGFTETIVETHFEFDTLEEARRLLAFYFGDEAAQSVERTSIGYRVAAYLARACDVDVRG